MSLSSPKVVSGKHSDDKNIWSLMFPEEFRQGEPSSMELIVAIKKGLPGNTIGKMAQIFDINKNQIYLLLNLKPKTAQRAAVKTSLSVDTSDHIVQILKVFKRCTDVFGSKEKASLWLNNPNLALGGEIPIRLMDTMEGISLVHDTVTRIEYGVFA
jgi:putative toxin-antitoxin system antitoxin component (TIGR02293 family)